MKTQILKAVRLHAESHVNKYKTNIEVLLSKATTIPEHADIVEEVETRLKEMAEYQDVIDMIDKHFTV